MFKTANVGTIDRILRFVLGAVLIATPFVYPAEMWNDPIWRYGAIAVGVVIFATAIIRFCPAYRLIGVSTCRT